MKSSCLLVIIVSSLLVIAAPDAACAGVIPGDGVPEPTAFLVWLGLAGAGGLLFWRRSRDEQ